MFVGNKFKWILPQSNAFISLALVCITIALWYIACSFGFLTFDDTLFITQNPLIADSGRTWGELLRFKIGHPDYFPISFLFWRLLKTLFDFNPFVFHAVNVLLHAANVVLVFYIGVQILQRFFSNTNIRFFAACIALAFSVHPLHVESVAWVICLKDMLFTAFYLTGLLYWFKWLNTNKKTYYWLALLAAGLSILSKSMGITFVAIIVLIDVFNRKKNTVSLLKNKVPFLVLTILALWIFGFLGDFFDSFNTDFIEESYGDPLISYPPYLEQAGVFMRTVFIASLRIFFWIKQFFIPMHQTVFYPREQIFESIAFLFPVLPLFLLGLVVVLFCLRKKIHLLWFGFLFFSISISPVLLQKDYTVATFVPDRYMYLPLLGLLLMLMALFYRMCKKYALYLFMLYTMVWGIISVVYLPVWKNSLSVYNRAIQLNPSSPDALLNRSVWYFENNNAELGLADIETFLNYYPTQMPPYVNRGRFYMKNHEYEKAIDDFTVALRMQSDNFDNLLSRGIAYKRMKNLEKAHSDFSAAYDIDSTHFILLKNIASMYNQSRNFPVSLQFAQKALDQKTTDVELLKIKAVALLFTAKFNQALEVLDRIIEMGEADGEVFHFKSMAYFETEHYEMASKNSKKSIDMGFEPDSAYIKKLNNYRKNTPLTD